MDSTAKVEMGSHASEHKRVAHRKRGKKKADSTEPQIKMFNEKKFSEIVSLITDYKNLPSEELFNTLKTFFQSLADINDWWDYNHGSLLDIAVGNQKLVNTLMRLKANRIIKPEKIIQFINNHSLSVRNYLKSIKKPREFSLDLGTGIGQFAEGFENRRNLSITDGILKFIAKNWSECPIDKLILASCACLTPMGIREFINKTNIYCVIVSSDQLKALTLPNINLDEERLIDPKIDVISQHIKKITFTPDYKLPGCDTIIRVFDIKFSYSDYSTAQDIEELDEQLAFNHNNPFIEAITIEDSSTSQAYIQKYLDIITTLPNLRVIWINNRLPDTDPVITRLTELRHLVLLSIKGYKPHASTESRLQQLTSKKDQLLGYYFVRRKHMIFLDYEKDINQIENDTLSKLLSSLSEESKDAVLARNNSSANMNRRLRKEIIDSIAANEEYMLFRLRFGDSISAGSSSNEYGQSIVGHPLYIRDSNYWSKVEDEKTSTYLNLRKEECEKFKRFQDNKYPEKIFDRDRAITNSFEQLQALAACKRLISQRLSDALSGAQKFTEYYILYKHPIIFRFRQTVEVLLRNYFLSAYLLENEGQGKLRTLINEHNPDYAFFLDSKTMVKFIDSLSEGNLFDPMRKVELLAEKTARLLALNMQEVLVFKEHTLDIYKAARVSVMAMMTFIVNGNIESEDTFKETAYNLMFAVIQGPKVKRFVLATSDANEVNLEILKLLKENTCETKKIRESQQRMESKLDEINSKIDAQNQLLIRRFDDLLAGVDERITKLSVEDREYVENIIRTQKEYFEKFAARQFKIDEELRSAIADLVREVQKDLEFAKDRFGRSRDNITGFKREFYLIFLDKMAKYSAIASGGPVPDTALRNAISTTGSIISELPSMGIAGVVAKIGTQIALAVYDNVKRGQYKKKDLLIQKADALRDFSSVIIDLAEAIAFIFADQLQHIVSYDKEPDEIRHVAETAVKLILTFCINHNIDNVFGTLQNEKEINPEKIVNILLTGLIFQGQQVDLLAVQKVSTIDVLFEDHHIKILGEERKIKPNQAIELLQKAADAGSDKLKEKINNAAGNSAVDLIVPVFEMLKGLINPDRRHWSIEGIFQRTMFLTFDPSKDPKSLEDALQGWGREVPHRHGLTIKEGTRLEKYGYCLIPISLVEQHNAIVKNLKLKIQESTRLDQLPNGFANVSEFHAKRIKQRREAIANLKTWEYLAGSRLNEYQPFEAHVRPWMEQYRNLYKEKDKIRTDQLTQEVIAVSGIPTREVLLAVLMRSIHYTLNQSKNAVELRRDQKLCIIKFENSDDCAKSRDELSRLAGVSLQQKAKSIDSQRFFDKKHAISMDFEVVFIIADSSHNLIEAIEEFCQLHQPRLINFASKNNRSSDKSEGQSIKKNH